MKQFIFGFSILLVELCSHPLVADEQKKAVAEKKEEVSGHLLYANTVGEKGWSFLVLSGEDIKPGGIEPGYCSAWVSYPAGKRQLQFEHQPLGIVDLETDLQSGGLHAFITYSDMVPQSERGRPPRPVLAVKELRCDLLLPPEKRNSSHLVLLNLTPAPSLNIRIGDETHEVPRLEETLLKPSKRGAVAEVHVLPSLGLHPVVSFHQADQPLAPEAEVDRDAAIHTLRLNFEDRGTRFVLFYTDTQNKVQSLLFDDIGMYPKVAEP